MKDKSTYRYGLFVAICILLGVGGRQLSEQFKLPFWLDSFGAAFCANAMGPVCGSVVSLATHIISGMFDNRAYIYGLVNIVIAVVIGIMARKKHFDTLFGTMTAGVLATLAALVVSVPLNVIFHDGYTNNIWGDSVIGFLSERGFKRWFCIIAGEFYVDFLDKMLTVFTLYASKRFCRYIKNKRGAHKNEHAAVSMLIVAALLCGTIGQIPVSAEQAVKEEYNVYSDYVHTLYSSDNGLPCGESNDVAQTNDGILWIGTYAGLYRYNGSEFRWMNEFDSVRNVNCLYVDAESRMWIGTNDNGLSICINENISNVIDKTSGLPSDSVRCITQASDGSYYIGTTESMAVITLSNGLKIQNVLPQINFAVSVTANDNGYAAAVNSEGKLFLLSGSEIADKKTLTATTAIVGKEEAFKCCEFGRDGLLYAGTSGSRIIVYDVSEGSLEKKKTISCKELQSVQSILFGDDGRAFVCADGGAGYFDDDHVFHPINLGSFNNSIDNCEIDYQGNLWFTSSRLGLLRLSESPFTDLYREYGLENKVVNTVEEWNGSLYFGTDNGLDIGDIRTSKQVKNDLTEMLDGIRIRCIKKDSSNDLWLCTYGKGLVRVTADGDIVTYNSTMGFFGNRARVAMEMRDGTLAVAGDTGMSFISDGKISKTIMYGDGLTNAVILSLLEAEDGVLLAGTDGDGIAIIRDGQVVRMLTRFDGLSSGVILRMALSQDGKSVYIVTSNGMCIMDGDYNISRVTNFPYSNNYDVWPDSNGDLFVMSSAGIYVLKEKEVLENSENMHYELLDAKKGLIASLTANSWNCCDDKGRLYVCSDVGVFSLDMSKYSSKRRSYRVMMNSVKLDGVTYPAQRGELLTIPRGTARMELFPEVINYTTEDPYVSFFLEGFDSKPTVLPQSELTAVNYTNLPSGHYVFRLSVLDGEDRTVLEERTYNIYKEMELYDHPWFIVYMLFVAMLMVAWLTWFIVRTQVQHIINIQQKQLELAEKQVQMGNQTILAIARTVDAKDENTSQHSQRVSDYSVMIGKELGFDDKECENLRKAALLHDIGKIGIPDRILNKPARLDDDEYKIMKTHVIRGSEILKDFTLVDNIIDGALYHHEKYDGTGYAHGLKGEDIPIYGRIIGVADAFDAMTANRVYRKKLDFDFVINEIERCKGTQFDPKIADIMLKLVRDGRIDIEAIYGKLPTEDDDNKEKTVAQAEKAEVKN
ncbi:HD domain-containing phosphohydrolase [uncultured Ruminococcus sp.]|uniref:HD domain-containing phosphohydrolase n=1 Tax=uncultured Ruminococcus sp. TaxID=165186 RepID=UPI0025D379BF|nr:HD domain-containing phosphohydrolase [uncultured Ruminococcus sp.]